MEIDLIVIISFLLLSAFFSGMEIAFVSANKIRLALDKNENGFIAKILSKLTEKPSNFITTMLVGNNVALVIYGFSMGDLITKYFSNHYPEISSFNELLLKTVISTLIILFTAEFLPKIIFQLYSNKLLRLFALPAYIIYVLFWPVTQFILWISNAILDLFFKIETEDIQYAFSKLELGKFISQQIEDSEANNSETDNELEILHNALDFADVKAREIMIPRTEIVAEEDNTSIEELKQTFIKTGLSKIIIYKENIDDIIGYIHSFEMFRNPKNIKSIVRKVMFVPETIPIQELLKLMTKQNKNIAIVLDEYGGTSGLITLEDIIEEIFGEIEDEHDKNELFEKQLDENTFIFSGRYEIEELNDKYHLNIPEDDSYDTLGGYILYKLGEIPEENEAFELDNQFYIKINKANQKQIQKVLLRKITDKD
ncbi:MAG TPA: HlyC/CorC family transporter [Bacteroidetes bacterium]|nr:HlyC/CorC family transporter [Bacteroidota bacterium]